MYNILLLAAVVRRQNEGWLSKIRNGIMNWVASCCAVADSTFVSSDTLDSVSCIMTISSLTYKQQNGMWHSW